MFQLLRQRSFGALTLAQFLGAFNDNAFKQLVLLLGSLAVVPWAAEHPWAVSCGQALPSALFALPFVLLGVLTGSLADRHSKSTILRAAAVLEILVMVLALLAFLGRSYPLLLVAVLAMGVQSAVFGPSKYGSIPEMLPARDLSRGNALIQTTTMLAIILGTIAGGFLLGAFGEQLWAPALAYIAIACAGLLAALRIEHLPAADPERPLRFDVVGEAVRHWRAMEGSRPLVLAVIGSAFFFHVATLVVLVVNEYGAWLGLATAQVALSNALMASGVALGAMFAARISGDRIESGLVPLGLLGLALALPCVHFEQHSLVVLRVVLVATGVAAGAFSIPIRALIQHLPRPERRGGVLGLSETLDFVGILLAALVFFVLESVLELDPPAMFTVLAAGVALFLAGSLAYTAEFFLRLVLLALVLAFYRLRVKGGEHLPRKGGALLVANHVSFVDALLIGAAAPRRVRFLMHRSFFALPLVGWFARRMGTLAIAAEDGASEKARALAAAAEAARKGELVCIFGEGAITRTGTLQGFRRGLERIAREAEVPIVPVALERLWGSVFSFERGRAFWKLPRRLPYPVDLAFGAPLASDTPAWRVWLAVAEAQGALRAERARRSGTLGRQFLRAARAHARQPALVDGEGHALSYRELQVGALALRASLLRRVGSAPSVGLLLPPSAAGVLGNLAVTLAGRVSVNLNPLLATGELASMLERAGATYLLTSRRMLAALDRPSPLPDERTLFIEDLIAECRGFARVRALFLALLPASLVVRAVGLGGPAEATATILYSSGSTGEPKGIKLSHANVLSNVHALLDVLSLGPGDGVLGILPFFHSFGYTVTLWTVLGAGARGIYHSSPLDARTIGDLCASEGATVIAGTPTFYQAWLRRFEPSALARARLCIVGAEKLREDLESAWRERFGLALYEGYGCTELSPVVAINLPDAGAGGSVAVGNKQGSVGRPIPGVAVRIVDPERDEILPPLAEGLVEVKSPGLMKGYLGRPELAAEVVRDGWYRTGDVGRLDEDGFLVLTDRLARFSKIGGEMVPHGRVEAVLREIVARLSSGAVADLAVTAVPDERKGEQLCVVHTPLAVPVETLVAELAASGLPRLFLPRASHFVEVEALPRTGTGKMDLAGLKRLARGALAPT